MLTETGMFKDCPACASRYVAYVRNVPCRRRNIEIPLYTCMECHSFWNPSGYVETESVRLSDLKWGIGVEERNRKSANQLLSKFQECGVSVNNLLEIGCGIGTFLEVVQERGGAAVGWELNDIAAEYGQSKGLDIRIGKWVNEKVEVRPDLITCISVLEHIEQPRLLIRELCLATIAQSCSLYISVPFLDRDRWHYLLSPNPLIEGTPFFDNDVHITHFSTTGLERALKDFGCSKYQKVGAGIWSGLLVVQGK